MKLALLGYHADLPVLARCAAQDPRFELVSWIEVTAESLPSSVHVPLTDDWESLLGGRLADAVIVAPAPKDEDPEPRSDQLRKLVQAGIPLMVIHPVCEPLMAFELEMIQRDSGSPLLIHFHGLAHPAIGELRSLMQAGPDASVGRVEQVMIERALSDRSRASVLRWLGRDLEWMRQFLGEINHVSAVGPRLTDATYNNMLVTLANQDGLLARWSVLPARDGPRGTVTLLGDRGKATLSMPDDMRSWKLAIEGKAAQQFPDDDDAARALEALRQVIARKSEPQPPWREVCRTFEVLDSAQVSLRRGRTIEVHGEEHTEENTFKGIMAVGGCGMVLLFFFALLLGVMAEGLRIPGWTRDGPPVDPHSEAFDPLEREPTHPLWIRMWPVYPLIAFLMLQLLLLITRIPRRRPPSNDKSLPESDSSKETAS